jgi:hypothetical protein
LLPRKEVIAVSPTGAFPKASPGPVVGKEWWKLDLEAAVVARIQMEVVVAKI